MVGIGNTHSKHAYLLNIYGSSSSSYSHFYVGSMFDDMIYASMQSVIHLLPRQSLLYDTTAHSIQHLLLGLFLFLTSCTSISIYSTPVHIKTTMHNRIGQILLILSQNQGPCLHIHTILPTILKLQKRFTSTAVKEEIPRKSLMARY